MELTEFLMARFAEDAAWAKEQERIAIHTHRVGRRRPRTPDHYSRILADVEAKRMAVREYLQSRPVMEATIRALAAAYADHPDYRPEWRL